MIARPLDLASTLRRQPRSFDWVFYVNFGLIALFFILFGSRFVLSPALAVDGRELSLTTVPEEVAGLFASTLEVSVKANGQIFVAPSGQVNYEQFRGWLAESARRTPGATLSIRLDESVRFDEVTKISVAAKEVGLFPVLAVRTVKVGAAQ